MRWQSQDWNRVGVAFSAFPWQCSMASTSLASKNGFGPNRFRVGIIGARHFPHVCRLYPEFFNDDVADPEHVPGVRCGLAAFKGGSPDVEAQAGTPWSTRSQAELRDKWNIKIVDDISDSPVGWSTPSYLESVGWPHPFWNRW